MVNLLLHLLQPTTGTAVESDAPKLDTQSSLRRRIVVALLWMGHHGGDAAYAIRSPDCDLRDASDDSLRRLKPVARYFQHTTDLAFVFLRRWSRDATLVVLTDSERTGERSTRKSYSCAFSKLVGVYSL